MMQRNEADDSQARQNCRLPFLSRKIAQLKPAKITILILPFYKSFSQLEQDF